jgi:hypothetical protein
MAIKKIYLNIGINVEDLIALAVARNTNIDISLFSDEKPAKLPKALKNGHTPLLLEGPKTERQRGKTPDGKPMTAYNRIIQILAAKPNHIETLEVFRPAVAELGLKPSTANSQMPVLMKRGHVRRLDEGKYQLLAAGLKYAKGQGFHIAEQKQKKSKKEEPAMKEANNG